MKSGKKTTQHSAIARRDNHRAPEIRVLHEAKSTAYPAGRMLIASPLALQDIITSVPRGRILTLTALRLALARRYKADYTCAITTGIFLRIAADAAEEDRANGATDVMPWWRVVRDDGALFEKLPGGAAGQARLLGHEGASIELKRGVPSRVSAVDGLAFLP